MRRDNKSNGLHKAEADGRVVHRGGVLQLAEQRPEGNASQAETAEAVQFLIYFVRELIRNNPSSDVLLLSMSAAAEQSNLTKDQAQKFIAWVIKEQANSPWPEGFFA